MARTSQLQSRKSYDTEINALVAAFDKRQRGEIVPYSEMIEVSGLDRIVDRNIWTFVMGKVKQRILESRGIALRCANNVGYRLMTSVDQLINQRHEKSAARKIRQGGTEKAVIRPDELDAHQQAIQAAVVHQAHLVGDVQRRQASERKTFLASHEAVNQFLRIQGLSTRATIIRDTSTTPPQT